MAALDHSTDQSSASVFVVSKMVSAKVTFAFAEVVVASALRIDVDEASGLTSPL